MLWYSLCNVGVQADKVFILFLGSLNDISFQPSLQSDETILKQDAEEPLEYRASCNNCS